MTIQELREHFYYGIRCEDYIEELDKYLDVLEAAGVSKVDFLNSLKNVPQGKGLDYITKNIVSDHSFSRANKDIEVLFKETPFSKISTFTKFMGNIINNMAIALHFYYESADSSLSFYRNIAEFIKTDDFKEEIKNTLLNEKYYNGLKNKEDCEFELSAFSHLMALYGMITENKQEIDNYYQTYPTYKDRYDNFPYVNDAEESMFTISDVLYKKPKKMRKENDWKNDLDESDKLYLSYNNHSLNDLNKFKKELFSEYNESAVLQYYQSDIIELKKIVVENDSNYYKNRKWDYDNIFERTFFNPFLQGTALGIVKKFWTDDLIEKNYDYLKLTFFYIKDLALAVYRILCFETHDNEKPENKHIIDEIFSLLKLYDCEDHMSLFSSLNNEKVIKEEYSFDDEFYADATAALIFNLHNKEIRRFFLEAFAKIGIFYPECASDKYFDDSAFKVRNKREYKAAVTLLSYIQSPVIGYSFPVFFINFVFKYAVLTPVNCIEKNEKKVEDFIKDYYSSSEYEEYVKQYQNGQYAKDFNRLYNIIYVAVRTMNRDPYYMSLRVSQEDLEGDIENRAFFKKFLSYYDYFYPEEKILDFDKNRIDELETMFSLVLFIKKAIEKSRISLNLVSDVYSINKDEMEELNNKLEEYENEKNDLLSDSDDLSIQDKINELKKTKVDLKNNLTIALKEKREKEKELEYTKEQLAILREERDLLTKRIEPLEETEKKYYLLLDKTLKASDEEIENLLNNRKIAITGGNDNTARRLMTKYPNIERYDNENSVPLSAKNQDYIFIVRRFNNHSLSEAVRKQVGNAKTIITYINTYSNFESTEKEMYYRIIGFENQDKLLD